MASLSLLSSSKNNLVLDLFRHINFLARPDSDSKMSLNGYLTKL